MEMNSETTDWSDGIWTPDFPTQKAFINHTGCGISKAKLLCKHFKNASHLLVQETPYITVVPAPLKLLLPWLLISQLYRNITIGRKKFCPIPQKFFVPTSLYLKYG